jgi:hypothetical protein
MYTICGGEGSTSLVVTQPGMLGSNKDNSSGETGQLSQL